MIMHALCILQSDISLILVYEVCVHGILLEFKIPVPGTGMHRSGRL